MSFEPCTLCGCQVVYLLRFYAYYFRTPLVGDTGSELPTRHAHGVVHKTILRALCVYNHEENAKDEPTASPPVVLSHSSFLGAWKIHASTAMNKLEQTLTYLSMLSQLPSGQANARSLGSASWAMPGARWRMISHKISTTHNP